MDLETKYIRLCAALSFATSFQQRAHPAWAAQARELRRQCWPDVREHEHEPADVQHASPAVLAFCRQAYTELMEEGGIAADDTAGIQKPWWDYFLPGIIN